MDTGVHQRHVIGSKWGEAVCQHGLQRLPFGKCRGAWTESRRSLWIQAATDKWIAGIGERCLLAGCDSESIATHYGWLCANYADLSGTDQRRRIDRPGRVHQ